MWFWWFMLGSSVLTPLLMLIGGQIFQKRCPARINSRYGYRTARSMQSMDAWRFAHSYCGRVWQRLGWGVLALTVPVFLPLYSAGEATVAIVGLIAMTVQLALLFYSIHLTEQALKEYETDHR